MGSRKLSCKRRGSKFYAAARGGGGGGRGCISEGRPSKGYEPMNANERGRAGGGRFIGGHLHKTVEPTGSALTHLLPSSYVHYKYRK